MSIDLTAQSLTYVWHPKYFSPSLQEHIQKNNLAVILDLSSLTTDQLIRTIHETPALELKLSAEQFILEPVQAALQVTAPPTLWVEYSHPFSATDSEHFWQQLPEATTSCCNLITGDLALLESCFSRQTPFSGVAIKGAESSGYVSTETTLTLLSHLETAAQKSQSPPAIHIWGGIATPEGAVACLASGVARIIFESVHWLTDLAAGEDSALAAKLASLRIDHSSTVELEGNIQFRGFDKGNSPAVKELEQLRASLNQTGGSAQQLFSSIDRKIVHPLETTLEKDFLIPLGPEAAFADYFCKQYGSQTITAIKDFANITAQQLSKVHEKVPAMLTGELTTYLGTKYPFIQGAMACISDVPAFALAVAKAGGLPTIAMGVKSIREIQSELTTLQDLLKGYSYAINVITLPENPYRDEQLEWIEKNKPPMVVISAGDPSHGLRLQNKGLEVAYVTSDIELLQLAWNSGIQVVICEGQEAGGHIGLHSTLTLAQAVQAYKREQNSDGQKRYLILAGGIYNATSLARAAVLGADGVQMGTLYLSSKEIVSSGALSKLYQQTVLASSIGDTVITGESVGLRVRAVSSPKTGIIRSLEKDLQSQTSNESAIRHQLEEASIGSLLIAARGRHPHSGELLPEEQCRQEGQFMSGAIAGELQEVLTVEAIHQRLAQNSFKDIRCTVSQDGDSTATIQVGEKSKERIAITGMAISNSLGNSPEAVWQACLAMDSGISEIPNEKWDHNAIYRENSSASGETYCKVGAFLSLDINRKELGIPPHDFRTMTASTRLTLWLAKQAITDSKITESDIPRHRIGVLVSQNAGEFGSTVGDLTIFTAAKSIVETIQQSSDISPEEGLSLIQTLRKSHLAIDDTTLLGRLNSAAGGFICNKYGFTGPSYSVTSACASSLTALYNSIQLIRNGVLDAAVIGGGEELITQGSVLEFSALGALAGKGYTNDTPAAFSRPFDAERSGMVLGEGGGIIVIERESVAKKRGAPIHAYITGTGASNNHQGMVESVAETQTIAIRASFDDAGYGPDEVDMVECHATGTNMGDQEEIKSLGIIYPKNSKVVVSSFKSQIGHTLGASGLNSLIRGVCAMNAATFPPTLNYDTPDPDVGLESAGFRVCKKPEPWPQPVNRPRRFEVNAFGFGGANYIVQIEGRNQHQPDKSQSVQTTQPKTAGIGVSFHTLDQKEQSYKIGFIHSQNNNTPLPQLLTPYKNDLNELRFKQKKALEDQGVTFAPSRPAPPLALVFSGQGTHYPRMGKQLYETFPVIRHWMDRLANLSEKDILSILFNDDGQQLQRTEWQQPSLFLLEYAIYQQLNSFGLQPTAMAGHSMGELTALCVAGCFSYEDGVKIINMRSQCMAKASTMAADPGTMLAVNAPKEYLEERIQTNPNLFFTNYNSPRQTVIGGSIGAVAKMKAELDNDGHWNAQLPVSMAFHSPMMHIIRDELGEFIEQIDMHPPQVPVLSNASNKPYPDDIGAIKETIISHLESPVHWQDNVHSLVNTLGCQDFLEIGPQDTLCSLIRECTANVHCLASCSATDEPLALRRAIATLYVRGHLHDLSTSPLFLEEKQLTPKNALSQEAIAAIIQQEVYSFALHGAEKYLKPAIVQAIQQQLDPSFSLEQLAQYMPTDSSQAPPVLPQEEPPVLDKAVDDAPVLEQVIQILMDATGYERDEIEPEMSVRDDLAIKSSRIPIIVDAAEKTFNITSTIEDFLTVQTVQDLADRVTALMDPSGEQPRQEYQPIQKYIETPNLERRSTVSSSILGINRLLQRQKELPSFPQTPLSIEEKSTILLLSLENSPHSAELATLFNEQYNCQVIQRQISGTPHEDTSINLYNLAEATRQIEELSANGPLSGLVLVSDNEAESNASTQEKAALAAGFFVLFQNFLRSPKRKFCLHFHLSSPTGHIESILSQSIQGLLLTAAKESKGILLRSVAASEQTDFTKLVPLVLNTSNPLLELLVQGDTISTHQACEASLAVPLVPGLSLDKEDVIILSGGGRGITSYLSRAFAPFGCTLILLGRNTLEDQFPVDELPDNEIKEEQFISHYLDEHYSELSSRRLKAKRKQIGHSIEIQKTVALLNQSGAKAKYMVCDVTDSSRVRQVVAQLMEEYGKVDGVIHGAGIIKDSYISIIKPEMFKQVMDVKLFGAENLLEATKDKGLRFAVGLSSIAANAGSVGQANYSMANRAMSSYLYAFQKKHPSILTKVFWLPPIEGTGMADTPEIKDILLQNFGKDVYLEVEEAAAIMLRELLCGSKDCWIVPLREVPKSDIVQIDPVDPHKHWFNLDSMGMLDEIRHLSLRDKKEVHATRTLSSARDPWLADHIPSKLFRYPIMSAIMAVEAFFEISHFLYPHLQINAIHNLRLLKMVECPPHAETEIELLCHGKASQESQQLCSVTLQRTRRGGNETSPVVTESYFTAEVPADTARVPLQRPHCSIDSTSTLVPPSEATKLYEAHSGLRNRYQVLHRIFNHTQSSIEGEMIYPEVDDFASGTTSLFHYPHYLLEALMQITFFFTILRKKEEPQIMIPGAIGSVRFSRSCQAGERLLLHAEMTAEDKNGITWDVFATNSSGMTIMEVYNLDMKFVD